MINSYKIKATICLLIFMLCGNSQVIAQQEGFIGQVKWFAGNFAPRGWANCDGQLLPINTNQALFSILGTTYGGDGRTTFALPDMRGRSPMHEGNGPGLSNRALGAKGGSQTEVLGTHHLPSHSHNAMASSSTGSANRVDDRAVAAMRRGYAAAADAAMDASAVANSGGSQAHNNEPPNLGVHCIIALTGIFPSRN